MKKDTMLKTFLVGALAVSMIAPLSISALADNTNSTSVEEGVLNPSYNKELRNGNFNRKKVIKPDFNKIKEEFESLLDELVDDGTLTSTQIDSIKTLAEENKGKRINLFNELINQGTLTEEEVDAINEKLHKKRESQNQERFQSILDKLVEEEIITEDCATEILDFISEKAEERKIEIEKIKDMTKEERKAYFEENKPEKSNLAESLVNEEIITQEQADELIKLLPKYGKSYNRRKGFGKDHSQNQEKLTKSLEKIVEDGILSQEKADKILDFINKKAEERKAEFEKIKDMTDEERKEYLKENRPQGYNLLEVLVEEEIITQDEADKLSSIFPNAKGHREFKYNK